MSGGGNVEGYLLLLQGDGARIVYCILDEGMLQYFSRMGGELLGAVALSGAKVDVFMLTPSGEPGELPHQFRVDAQPRAPPVRRRGAPRANQPQKVVSLTLAGATSELASQWAISILNWNRYSWEDGQLLCSSKDEFKTLTQLLNQSGAKSPKSLEDPVVPTGISPAVAPI